MNWRQVTYLLYARLRGYRFPAYLARYRREYRAGLSGETATRALGKLLAHCRKAVPYYARLMERMAGEVTHPREYLQRLPVLTKSLIREHFEELQSADLGRRKWAYNTSGGSTGEPLRLIQDREYEDRSKAIALLCDSLLGCEPGQSVVRLWGSERDLARQVQSPKARFFNRWTNTLWMNAFEMSSERMGQFVRTLNRVRPQLIVAYAQAAYELARFIEAEGLKLEPQRVVATSAGTLYPFMRETIGRVFGCAVVNRYGSREVSFIASELPHVTGLWVPPWGNFVEILDDGGAPVPTGEEGNIVVTCLTNYAMPLVRYAIGDRGALMPEPAASASSVQFLQRVSGRNVDMFRTANRTLVDGEYFTHLLYFRPWVRKFQVVQKAEREIVFKVVRANGELPRSELEDIAARARLVMGPECRVEFEFAQELPAHPSGKYRYTISEVLG